MTLEKKKYPEPIFNRGFEKAQHIEPSIAHNMIMDGYTLCCHDGYQSNSLYLKKGQFKWEGSHDIEPTILEEEEVLDLIPRYKWTFGI